MVPPAESGTSASDYDYHGNKHPYHLVDPSPWPFVGSMSAMVMMIGAVLYMQEIASWVFILGFVGVLGTMAGWFWEVIKEAEYRGFHNQVVQVSMRYGMVLFIASEVMFFVAWFWAYFNASLFPTVQIEGQWPPPGVQTFDTWDLPFLNTLILLTSGITVTWAHHALREGNRKHFLQGLLLTIFLGICFTCVQAFEYSHAAFGFQDGIYSSTFYYGDRLPWFPRPGGHDLPARLLFPRTGRALQAGAPFRFRSRCLVLAFRRRGMAVPVHQYLLVGTLIPDATKTRRVALYSVPPVFVMTEPRIWPRLSPMSTGLACKCPRCGKGRLFNGLLEVRDTCAHCELDSDTARYRRWRRGVRYHGPGGGFGCPGTLDGSCAGAADLGSPPRLDPRHKHYVHRPSPAVQGHPGWPSLQKPPT